MAQLLALMDGLESRGNVVVLAATNVPDLVDLLYKTRPL